MYIFILAMQEMPPDDINFPMLMLRMLVFLALVLALIWVFLRKFLPFISQTAPFRNRNVKILERLPLDTKRSLLVVEVQERVYLLGSAEGQINVLLELDRDKMPSAHTAIASQVSFDQVLKRMFTKSKPDEPPKN